MQLQSLQNNPDPRKPQIIESQDTTYMVYPEFPKEREILELAATAFREKRGLQIITEGELPFIRRFCPKEFSRLQLGEKGGVEKTGLDWGITKLKELQQFLGPIDDLLVHRPQEITKSWVDDKVIKLNSIFGVVGYNSTVALPEDASLTQQVEFLKIAALDCLCKLDIEVPPFRYEKRRNTIAGNSSRFEYVKKYAELLGDNLLGVIAYGGSITAASEAEIKDFDNLVVVSDVRSACQVLRAHQFSHLGKEVHAQILPESACERYLLMSYAPSFRPDQIRLVYGDINLPIVDHDVLVSMGTQLFATNVFARRKSLLSRFIDQAETFQEKVKADSRSIAMIEAHTIVPLATLGWLKQFIGEPQSLRLSKRHAAEMVLIQAGLSELNPRMTDATQLLDMTVQELRQGLVDAIVKTSAALQHYYLHYHGAFNVNNWIIGQ